ncbi:MAG: prenyltransferase [Acidobacteriia bacterium]|nr:prenyltransferase [Terriglobia bacterium]
MATLKAWLGVARAPFLLLPVTLVASGAAAASYAYSVDWPRTLLALVGLIALHASVNALNEASDFRAGIDLKTRRTPFSGGSGTLPAGALAPRTAFLFGLGAAAVGLAIGIVLLFEVGPVLLPVLVVGAVCVLLYSDVLTRNAAGEVAAGLGLGALPVIGTALIQNGTLPLEAAAACIPAFFMTFDLLLLNEFPDEGPDREGGRKHLVVLLGRRGAALLYALAALLTPASIAVAVAARALPRLCLVALVPSLLLFLPLRWAFTDPKRAVPVGALAANVAWNLLTNAGIAAGLAASSFA